MNRSISHILNYFHLRFFLLVILLSNTLASFAQLTGIKNIPGDYVDLASAISDLNASGVGSGGVTLNLLPGNPQISIAGGYVISAEGSISDNIIIQGNGNVITAFTPQTIGNINDAIFKLIGGDWITLKDFILQENLLNIIPVENSNTMTEWGIALLYTSVTNGSQHNSILNNTISLNRSYANTFGIYSNTRHSANNVITNDDIQNGTTAPNSNNKIYGNNISNVNMGIAFIGAGNPFGGNAFTDSGNDIGGTSITTGNTFTNWGGAAAISGYVSNSFSSYCILLHNQISENVSFNFLTSASVVPTTSFRGILREHSAASNGFFTSNINNNSITMTSGQTSGAFTCIDVKAITLNMTINVNDNVIQNCVITGSTSSSSMIGIANQSHITSFSANRNIFINNISSSTTGGFYGIYNQGNVTSSINMNNNQVGNNNGGAITFTDANSDYSIFIYNTGGTETTTLNMNGNNFQGITYNVTSGANNIYLANTVKLLSTNINNNTFTNLNVKIAGQVIFIYNSIQLPDNGGINVNNNSIVTGYFKSAPGNEMYFYYNIGTGNTNTFENNNDNNFSNITLTGNTIVHGWFNNSGFTNKSIIGNTFSSISSPGSQPITIINCYNGGNNGGSGNLISNNIISTINGGGSITGILVGNGGKQTITSNIINNIFTSGSINGINGSGGTVDIGSNILHSFSSSAGEIRGLFLSVVNLNIFKNKIYNLEATHQFGYVAGIDAGGGTNNNIYNNIIGDLRTPAAYGDNLKGINIGSGNLYYNTIYLNASSTGPFFTSYGVYASYGSVLNLRNNIIVNNSTPTGSGRAVAFYRTNDLSGYPSSSDNNLFYAGNPSPSHLIFFTGGSGDQTLNAFKSRAFPADAHSITENPPFLSITGSSPAFLHINPNVSTQIESHAGNIAGMTDDFDSQIRQGNPGYLGASGSAPDIGADEGNFTTTWYQDADGDTYTNPSTALITNSPPAGYLADNSGDCNDANPNIHPNATELCNNIDDNCDGNIDEGIGTISSAVPQNGLMMYLPFDGNVYDATGRGHNGTVYNATLTTDRFSASNRCYNFNGSNTRIEIPDHNDFHSSNVSVCAWIKLNGTNGMPYQVFVSKSFGTSFYNSYASYYDNSNSEIGMVICNSGSCSSTSAPQPINSGWIHYASTFDDGTDQLKVYINGNLVSTISATTQIFYDNSPVTIGCEYENGGTTFFSNSLIDDVMLYNRALTASEISGIAQSGTPLFDGTWPTWYADVDGDLFGNASVTTVKCAQPAGYVSDNTDCDDSNALVHPGATEICNGIDDNCNSLIDDTDPLITGQPTWYIDNDGDGYGTNASLIVSCNQPGGYVLLNTDCNDTPASGFSIHPSATEICDNGIDENCNLEIDEVCSVTLNLKLFIDGFYLGGDSMIAVVDPVNYPLLCDTIIVELHNAVTPYNMVYTLKGVIDIFGNGKFIFPLAALNESYYIVIKHRNAIETWSSLPFYLNNYHVAFDFTRI